MARNLSGRRRVIPRLSTRILTFSVPFRGGLELKRLRHTAAAGLPVGHLRAGQHAQSQKHRTCSNIFNVKRRARQSTALEIGYLGSRSHRLERMFDWNETMSSARAVSETIVGPNVRSPELPCIQDMDFPEPSCNLMPAAARESSRSKSNMRSRRWLREPRYPISSAVICRARVER